MLVRESLPHQARAVVSLVNTTGSSVPFTHLSIHSSTQAGPGLRRAGCPPEGQDKPGVPLGAREGHPHRKRTGKALGLPMASGGAAEIAPAPPGAGALLPARRGGGQGSRDSRGLVLG